MRGRSDGGRADTEDDPDEGRGAYSRTERRLIRQWLNLAYHVDGMSWDRYLALPVRRRTAMHIELAEMLESAKPDTPPDGQDSDEGGSGMRPKRMRR